MSSSQKILLVLGAGKNIGQSVAKKFKDAGYKVALVSRSAHDKYAPETGYLELRGDLANSASIPGIFEDIKAAFGGSPNVVVYNAAALTPPDDPSNFFSIPTRSFESDLTVMNTSAFVAAREAIAGFETLGSDTRKSFIYTGTRLAAVTSPWPLFATLGTGKSAASYWIGSASEFFNKKEYKFYYADERTSDGHGVSLEALSGEEAAKFYLDLAEGKQNPPWYATFVRGKGYVYFPESSRI
ncbi:short chain dehydrogenase family protein [Metarhizium robertsii]|uniref:NAD(P)-binding domain protein n=2 Tax=Metarhizium robertsii TaxID=568076 RepID=E9EMU9_METRA|nr:NAD(P)-binding domain protein [Metarhizium robertsii ARSEF 23]EFZ03293.1 NAD(P)-binding domain protein [Metarhizium robertsii ARSEF 23]EXU95790.1 short chain dehydrogenase family protein [Metarhizium robertsii]